MSLSPAHFVTPLRLDRRQSYIFFSGANSAHLLLTACGFLAVPRQPLCGLNLLDSVARGRRLWGVGRVGVTGVPHRRASPCRYRHPGLRRGTVWDVWVQQGGKGISRSTWGTGLRAWPHQPRSESQETSLGRDVPAEPRVPSVRAWHPDADLRGGAGLQGPREPLWPLLWGVEERRGSSPPRRGALGWFWRGALLMWSWGSGR